jgi:hypothetical protein
VAKNMKATSKITSKAVGVNSLFQMAIFIRASISRDSPMARASTAGKMEQRTRVNSSKACVTASVRLRIPKALALQEHLFNNLHKVAVR